MPPTGPRTILAPGEYVVPSGGVYRALVRVRLGEPLQLFRRILPEHRHHALLRFSASVAASSSAAIRLVGLATPWPAMS